MWLFVFSETLNGTVSSVSLTAANLTSFTVKDNDSSDPLNMFPPEDIAEDKAWRTFMCHTEPEYAMLNVPLV